MTQTRRSFLKTASASTAALITSFETFAAPAPVVSAAPGYELLILATDWGFKGTRDELCAAVKKEGYDGIEVWWPGDAKGQDELFTALKKHGLQVGFLCGGWQEDPKEHFDTFKKVTTDAATNKTQKPLYINCHSGKDFYPVSENNKFVEHTIALAKQTGIGIYHETHRGRIMFAAHVTKDYMQRYPGLQLTFDVSHWCNVHESLLADQSETVNMALERVEHIHSRIGHAEGPQVSDPRAPEWKSALEQHLAWWDKIIARKKQLGQRMTILTEFGPPDYLPTLPYTRQPVADQWAINVHMMQLLRQRYK